MTRLLVILGIVAAIAPARADTCVPAATQRSALEKTLHASTKHEVSAMQACNGFVSYAFTHGAKKTEQVASCIDQTCTVIATWRDVRNCDSGMCDHFSTTEDILLRGTMDLDGDGKLDVVIDFATITGDQGHEHHALSAWLSSTKALRTLGYVARPITAFDTIETGFAVTSVDFSLPDTNTIRTCFDLRGPLKVCP